MATITATATTTPQPRVSVALAAWSVDGPVDVYRVHPDTTRWLVRGMSAVSGAVAFGFDYEAPHMTVVHYEALNGSTLIVSADVTVSAPGAYLSAPGLPSVAMALRVVSKPQVTRPKKQTVIEPWGRSNVVVLGDVRKSGQFTIKVLCFSWAEADQLDEALDSGVLLLRMPGARYSWQYVAVGDVVDNPLTQFWASSSTDDGAASSVEVPCTVTDAPVGGIYGDPTASYQAWKDDPPGTTYGDDRTHTYLQLLQGL